MVTLLQVLAGACRCLQVLAGIACAFAVLTAHKQRSVLSFYNHCFYVTALSSGLSSLSDHCKVELMLQG